MDAKEIWDKMQDAKTRVADRKRDEIKDREDSEKAVTEEVTKIRDARAKIDETVRNERDGITQEILDRIAEIYESIQEYDPDIKKLLKEEEDIKAEKLRTGEPPEANDKKVRATTVGGFPALQWGNKFDLTKEEHERVYGKDELGKEVKKRTRRPILRPNRDGIPDKIVFQDYSYITVGFDVPRKDPEENATIEGIPLADVRNDVGGLLDVVVEKLKNPVRVENVFEKREDFWKPIMPPVSDLMKSK